jgi:uncharacterized membrane protein
MKISLSHIKLTRNDIRLNSIGNIIGAAVAVIFIIILSPIIIISNLFPGNKKEREIKDIHNMTLDWKLIIENEYIKVYQAFINDWPEDLAFIDFHHGDEYVKKFKTDPEIEELNKYYFGEFLPYDIENNYIEYHNGIYIIAYPLEKNDADNYTLFHLDFQERKLIKIQENILPVKRVNYPDDNSIEIVTEGADEQIVICIKK